MDTKKAETMALTNVILAVEKLLEGKKEGTKKKQEVEEKEVK